MDNDSRGLLFFILGFTCVWLVFDNFFGKKYVNNLAGLLTPDIPSWGQSIKDSITQGIQNAWKNQSAADQAQASAKDKIDKDPSLSDTEKAAAKKAVDDFYKNDPLAKAGPQAT
jgi:hypothetical protein